MAGQKFTLYLDKGVLVWRGNTIPLVNKDSRLLTNKNPRAAAYYFTIWKRGRGLREASVSAELTNIGLVGNSIYRDTGVAMAAMVFLLCVRRKVLVRYIIGTAQPQKAEMRYLGHIVSERDVTTNPDEVARGKATSLSEVKTFLGFVGCYMR